MYDQFTDFWGNNETPPPSKMYDHDAQETVKYIFLVKKITRFFLLLLCIPDPYCKWYDLWTLWVWNRGVVGQKTQRPYQVEAQRTSYNSGVPLWWVLGKHCQSCWKSGNYSNIIDIRFFPALKISYLPHKSIELSVKSIELSVILTFSLVTRQ